MRLATKLSAAAFAASAMFAAPASAQLISFTTTGFFTGAGATPCTTAVVGTTATCSYGSGATLSTLTYNGSTQQNVVGQGNANFGSFQTAGSNLQSYLGNSFTMVVTQTSPTAGVSPNIMGMITGTFSATAQGGSGGLVWTPNVTTFAIGGANYRLFVDNTGGINIEPPSANGVISDMQTLRGNVSVVPEPSTYLLMASGLVGMGMLYRRRRSA